MAPRDNSSAPALDQPGVLHPAAWAGRLSDYKQLVKPRITALVVITATIGFAVASGNQVAHWPMLMATLLGTALACMGASVFNQVWERDTDALMPRTAQRPMPAQRLAVPEALILGSTLAVGGVLLLWLLANALAAAIAAGTILSYALIYTPLKRTTWWATAVGAVPGAAPPLIGSAAAAGEVTLGAWLLFAILFVWQLPHFYAIAWLYRSDYARAGLKMLPVVDADGRRTFRQILITSAALLVVGVLPTFLQIAGWWYFTAAALAGGIFFGLGLRLKHQPTAERARALFLASLIYLPLVMTMMVVDLQH
jgi:protoheme IX farnesyltransferase